jgi:hypothetical protein
MDRTVLAESELYSKFRSMTDTIAWADIVGARWQPLDDALLELQRVRHSFTTDAPSGTVNDPLTKLAATFGYQRGAAETDASVIKWGQGYARACRSFGSLDDLLYVANLLFGGTVGLTSNEFGPTFRGTYQDTLSVTLESDTDAHGIITSLDEVNRAMALLRSMVDATVQIQVGIDLREIVINGTTPPIPRKDSIGAVFAFDGWGGSTFDQGGMFSLISDVVL